MSGKEERTISATMWKGHEDENERKDRQCPFSGPGVRRRGDKSFWRSCEVQRSDRNIVWQPHGQKKEAMKSFLTWIGRKVQSLFRDRGG